MFQAIKALLARCWAWIKKIFLKILNFFKNIVSFFRTPNRLETIQKNQNTIAVAIKEKLDNGDYQVCNCLFNKDTTTLVNPEEDAQVITSGNIDEETRQSFGNKDMVVLA